MSVAGALFFFALEFIFFAALFALAVTAGTHIAFHTWRKLERKYPRG